MRNYVWMLDKLNEVEKYVFGYLVSCQHLTNDWGYYHIPTAYIMADLGLTKFKVETAIKGLIEKKLIAYDQSQSMVAIAGFNRFTEKPTRDICGRNAVARTLDAFIHIPASGVFATTKEWLCAYAPEDAVVMMDENPWVKEALSKEVPEYIGTIKHKKAKPEGSVELFRGETASAESAVAPAPAAEEDTPAEAPAPEPEVKAEKKAEAKPEEPKAEKKKEKAPDPVKEQHEKEFESLWAKYPRKEGKKAAHDGYFKMLKNGEITFSVASKALDKYLYQCKKNGTEKQYIMNGSSFFGAQKRVLEFVEAEEEAVSQEDEFKKLKEKYASKFNTFWLTYPRKEGKEIAEKNYIEILKGGEYTPEQLQQAAIEYAGDCQSRNTETRYIKRADTFLDPETRPFRDFLNREEENKYYVNVHSGTLEKEETSKREFEDATMEDIKKAQQDALEMEKKSNEELIPTIVNGEMVMRPRAEVYAEEQKAKEEKEKAASPSEPSDKKEELPDFLLDLAKTINEPADKPEEKKTAASEATKTPVQDKAKEAKPAKKANKRPKKDPLDVTDASWIEDEHFWEKYEQGLLSDDSEDDAASEVQEDSPSRVPTADAPLIADESAADWMF